MMLTRFWSKVDASGDCWEWTGARSSGYGKFRLDGRTVRAHRYAYEQLVGPVPAGIELDHLCRVGHCVNPDHLDPVTHQRNLSRGVGGVRGAVRQLAKTHCPNGHPYSGPNLYRKPDGRRCCRTCRAAQSNIRHRKDTAA